MLTTMKEGSGLPKQTPSHWRSRASALVRMAEEPAQAGRFQSRGQELTRKSSRVNLPDFCESLIKPWTA